MQNLFNPASSHKAYRAARAEATSKGPVMPYLYEFVHSFNTNYNSSAVTLSDLTFAEDGNQDYLSEDKSIINWSKRNIISGIIRDLLINQVSFFRILIC